MLTEEIKSQITTDVSAFREYLLRLGIPVSDEIPPIGVSAGPGSSQTHVSGALPLYRSDMTITQGWFVNRRAITRQYANYAMDEMLSRRGAQHPNAGLQQDTIVAAASSQYYNWSYWEHKPTAEGGYWSTPLWDVRSRFGKDFTDRLVAFTLKTIIDNPEEGADPNFDIYFCRKLQEGDSVIDDNSTRMGEITEIIKKSGIDIAIAKAYLDFAGIAVRRNDGSFTLRISVINKSSVPANRGQFRVYFAPDVQLVVEPRDSLKDSLTTLRSARLIPFETIPAHSSFESMVEFKPISNTFIDSKFFVAHFDYHCESCGVDRNSHDLKFKLDLFDPGDSGT